MMKKLYYLTTIICCTASFGFAQENLKNATYKNAKAPVESRVKDLLSRMSVAEKVGQVSTFLGWEMYEKQGNSVQVSQAFKTLEQEQFAGMLWATLRADPWTKKTLANGLNPTLAAKATNALQKYAVENTRLGIPLFLAEECPHGHMAIGTTVFPTSIGQASTWNPQLIQKMASAIAEETRLQGGQIGYGPVLDLAREPRWSRVEETYGEDPFLTSRMGVAMVKGMQGNGLEEQGKVIATLKHFMAYGAPEGGHNGGSISVGERSLNQYYYPPFKAAVDAGVLSVMTAYNSIDGIPCSSNAYLLKDLLINQWKFKGFSVSDLGSISGLVNSHHVAEDAEHAAALAINAGLDADLSGYGYGKALIKAVNDGLVSKNVLDTAVSRVLRLKFQMGLFENPFVDAAKARKMVRSAEKVKLAADVARESIVLLKNDHNILPLSKSLRKLAVIGPNAAEMYNQLGDYTAPQSEDNVITVLKGIQNKLDKSVDVKYVKGCSIRDTSESKIAEAVALAQQSDATVVVLGGSSARDFKTAYESSGAASISKTAGKVSDMESGEGFDRSTLDLMGDQLKLLQALKATGKPVVLVLIMGRPLNLNYAKDNIDGIINAWYPGQEGGTAIADVLFGDYNPAGRLPVSFPKSVGQLPVYYNATRPARRDYVEGDSKPLYSFGYGLSYTQFEYSNLNVAHARNGIQVTFDVKNTGNLSGDEVPQLYIAHKNSSIVLPVQELKAFQRLNIKSGENKHIVFTVSNADLMIFDTSRNWSLEKGTYQIMVGPSSDSIKLNGNIDL
ncbi:glycoside hydrolase family 3 N-terminal domain-containing protein [Pedobacter sp. AW1-32]|uniref:glycoside hydrolase family 3 N-terminal domain-containing protein n=1 Tax=Pedobacter sp. AW1-32 TaxID=3383026 RepID=UPI003FF0724D